MLRIAQRQRALPDQPARQGPRVQLLPFPQMPDTNTVVNRGLNTRPVFYGCNAANATNANTSFNGTKTPIIVYLPSYPYAYLANTSTFQARVLERRSPRFIDNSVDVASVGGADSTWPTCLACALLQRGFERSTPPRLTCAAVVWRNGAGTA